MKTIGYQGMVVGDRDLSAGLAFLQDSAKEAGLALYSANLADAAGKALFTGHFSFPAGPLSVCAVAVSPQGNYGTTVQAQDPVAAAQRELTALSAERCDIKILAANLPRPDLEKVLTQAKGFDFAATAHDGWQAEPQLIAGVPVVFAGQRGRNVEKLEIVRNDGSGAFADLGALSRQADETGRLGRQIADLEKQMGTAQPPMQKTLAMRLDALRKRQADLAKLAPANVDPPRSFRSSFATLDLSVADDPALKKLQDDFTAKYPEPAPAPRPVVQRFPQIAPGARPAVAPFHPFVRPPLVAPQAAAQR